ncbi:MAG: PAQR family membrane homeostasis protein TrhA [Flavobacteriaceae bacterium]
MYSKKEERINIWSHAIGFITFLLLGVILCLKTIGHSWIWTSAALIYSLSLAILYLSSTLYHNAPADSKKREKWRIMDHASIYLLIAGSYTPFCLVGLYPEPGIHLFYIIWAIAIAGVILKIFFTGRFDYLSTAGYLAMGWMAMIYWEDFSERLTHQAVDYLIIGGIFYSIGAILYAIPKIKYNHAIFHFFIIAGSLAHFIGIYFYVFNF